MMKIERLQLKENIPRPTTGNTARYFSAQDGYEMELDEATGLITVRKGKDTVVTHTSMMIHAIPKKAEAEKDVAPALPKPAVKKAS